MWLKKKLITGALALASTQSALACGYHGAIGDHLSVMHPDSVVVAVALRRAAQAGTVNLSDLETALRRPGIYLDVVRRLQKFRSALAPVILDSNSDLTFSLGFVESGLWTRYGVSDGTVTVDIHTKGPREGEAVLLTGEPVLAEILNGTLTVDHAQANRLLMIEGQDHEKATIYRALTVIPLQETLESRQLSAVVNNPTANSQQKTHQRTPENP